MPKKIVSKVDAYKHTNEFLEHQNRKINKLREKKILLGHLMRITKSQEYHKLSPNLKEVIDSTSSMNKNIQDFCFEFY